MPPLNTKGLSHKAFNLPPCFLPTAPSLECFPSPPATRQMCCGLDGTDWLKKAASYHDNMTRNIP